MKIMKTRRSDSRLCRGRKLDVSLRADPRNKQYRMQDLFGSSVTLPPQSKVWPIALEHRLDQKSEGSCVGFAGAHSFAAGPFWQNVTTKIARLFYKGAQKHDQWPGENYEGTSVNGLMAFLKLKGWIGEYRWIYDIEELKRTLSWHGEVIVGSAWKEQCFRPDREGFIRFDGASKGGHATCWCGINIEEGYFLIQQSWGRGHGIEGQVRMRFADAEKLLRTGPQIAFPSKRIIKSLTKISRPWWQFWK